ncbi:hypothetical protein EI94DRAFT_1795256 [Lactarius quietus]|nr:hypothetical protein EI94DRAFT_1795256 [Lactarius quietus]
MSSTYTLWCLIDGDKTAFKVVIPIHSDIDDLKDSIKQKRSHHLAKFDAADLILWKLNKPESIKPAATDIATRVQSHGYNYSRFAIELEDPSDKVLTIFANKPPDDCLHVFITLPIERSEGKRPCSSSGAEGEGKRMKPEVPPWLTELHSKIWNRVDLTQTLTRTVEVTEAHYTDLQRSLNGLHKRTAIDLVKLNILHSLREAVPSLQDEVESDVSEARDNHKLFPSVFKYLDLAPLGLKGK